MSIWTPSHEAALRQIAVICRQHFDHAIIAVALAPDHSEDEGCAVYEWIGGRIPAMGLAVSFQEHLKNEQKRMSFDPDEDVS